MQTGPGAGSFSERQHIGVLAHHAAFPKTKSGGQDTSRTQHECTLSASPSRVGRVFGSAAGREAGCPNCSLPAGPRTTHPLAPGRAHCTPPTSTEKATGLDVAAPETDPSLLQQCLPLGGWSILRWSGSWHFSPKAFPGLPFLASFFYGPTLCCWGKAYGNCQPIPAIFLPSCFPFPSWLWTFADRGAPHSSSMQGTEFKVKKNELTGHLPILCAAGCKQRLYDFPNLCTSNLLVAHLSRLRSPAGTAGTAGQATVRPPDTSWRRSAAVRFLFCLRCSLHLRKRSKSSHGKCTGCPGYC